MLLNVQSVPTCSVRTMANCVPLSASAVSVATAVPTARTVIEKVKVCAWVTMPTLSASSECCTRCPTLNVGLKLSIGLTMALLTMTASFVFQFSCAAMDLLLWPGSEASDEFQGDDELMDCARQGDRDVEGELPAVLHLPQLLLLVRRQLRGIQLDERLDR